MRLKLQQLGSDCEGIRLMGNPKNPEPDHVMITFPGGDVDVCRTSTGDYWIHVRVNREGVGLFQPDDPQAKITDARIDIVNRAASEVDAGEFNDPNLYHLAVRITRT